MKSLFGETYVAPKTPLTPLLILRALFNGGVQWAGEAIVGLIPLIAYGLTHGFGKDPYITALCSPRVLKEAYASFSSYCTQYPDSPLQEICVLSVVISGLSLLSIGQFAPGRRQAPRTALTYLMQILAIVSLLAGGLFYALITAHLNEGHETWAYAVLVVALVSSFVLAIQESVSAIHRERVQVEPDQTSMQQ